MLFGSSLFLGMIKIAFICLFFPYFMIVLKASFESTQDLMSTDDALVVIMGFLAVFEFFRSQNLKNLKYIMFQVVMFSIIFLLAVDLSNDALDGISVKVMVYFLFMLLISRFILQANNNNCLK